MEKVVGICPICGCELSHEPLSYRCWCCNKRYSRSEVTLLRQSALEQPRVMSVRAGIKNDERRIAV